MFFVPSYLVYGNGVLLLEYSQSVLQCILAVLGPQKTTEKAINLMKVIHIIKGLATITETYHAHI